MPSFKGSIFDTGGIPTFFNIKYVNEYLDEIESINIGNASSKPKIIYECYKPKHIMEMKEYILYTIDKSLKQAEKKGILTNDHLKIMGKPGCGKNLSAELMAYKYIK